MNDELREILRALPERRQTMAAILEARDTAATKGRTSWADLWAYLLAELADIDAAERCEWSGFVKAHNFAWRVGGGTGD